MSTPATPPTKRSQQLIQTYRMAKKSDRLIGLYTLLAFVVGAAIGFAAIFYLPGGQGTLKIILSAIGAILFGVLAALIIFGRRAQAAAFNQMDGKQGAAASALQMLRRGWKTDPVVGFTKQQDIVHRVIGPPGIVLVGEGNSNRLKGLLATERRKHERVLPETPIHEVICGNGEGEVPLPKLVRHVTKLGRNVKPAEITDILARLKAIDAQRGLVPMPKGPMPTKGMRGQQRGR